MRNGYVFESSGRGKNYTITIKALPKTPSPFEAFAKREFECAPQTNFKGMEIHFFLLFYHPEYQFLPSNHQAKYIEENYGMKLSDQSLRNWQKLLIKKNWISKDTEKVKYVLCRKNELPREMAAEDYKRAWRIFYSRIAKGEDAGEVRQDIYYTFGGMPRKQVGFTENALESIKLQELRNILENLN